MQVQRVVAALAALVVLSGCGQPPESRPPRTVGAAGTASSGDPYYPDSGNSGYLATKYEVSISYDPASRHLDGDTVVTAKAVQNLSELSLDLDGLDVRSVLLDGRKAEFGRSGGHKLVVKPAEAVAENTTFTVQVRYEGTPAPVTTGRNVEGWQVSATGGAFAAGEPHSASTWFPVNDTPANKAPFHLAARVPDGWSAISVGREGRTESKDGWTTYRWDEATPIAPYLTTVAIDKWAVERGQLADGTPVVSAFAPGAEDKKPLAARLPEILDFLASKFGKYPQDAAGGIFLADALSFSLETQTRPTYAKWTDLTTTVHENAHQWWGDSVSVDKWKDVCLNECFASYAQWLWDEAKQGVNLDQRYRDTVRKHSGDTKFWGGKLYDMGAGNEFGAVYDKGPMALHALRRLIGEDAFNAVLKGWPALHREGNASWTQFEDYATKTSGRDLTGFFGAWFRGTVVPPEQYLLPGSLRS
ncbi:M1 family metallopeptidase [Kutzneria viridogrisea]|uniref:Aminopeptidase N n=2 Tax=Kutzneria TaxID=43356 RepID=W5W6G4_9PSEU|nr:M1 family metallopeptidase [Kutzneria albida]AHH93769.1 peptidase M1 membrane alanine aminopeptidase [Kutzneria albida DSM 43870]MBA8931227.1 aminopeptidase N [Kutzneria viridogrisea]